MSEQAEKNPRDEARRDLEHSCVQLGRFVAAALPPGIGFVLSIFEFKPEGWNAYMSNGRREDIAQFLRELAEKLEEGGS